MIGTVITAPATGIAVVMIGTIVRAIAGMVGTVIAAPVVTPIIVPVMIGTVIRAATGKNLLICGIRCSCLADEAASVRGAGWQGAADGGKKSGGNEKLGDGHGSLHWVARHSADTLEI